VNGENRASRIAFAAADRSVPDQATMGSSMLVLFVSRNRLRKGNGRISICEKGVNRPRAQGPTKRPSPQ
jgi:hypothetical protein